MRAIFTIISYNYLPLAWSLMDSIAKTNESDFDLFIVVADSKKEDLISLKNVKSYNITYLAGEEIFTNENFRLELAFKYDVTEFCTSLKPYTFLKLADENKYEGIIYFDPDFIVYSDISDVFEKLQTKLCVVTPHYYNIEENHSGYVSEKVILFAGIFNFGFFAINPNHKDGIKLLKWWANRLVDGAYHDKVDAYHTDQKWMDYLPTYFGDDVFIIRKPGYNLAIWNLHQRNIIKDGGKFLVHDIGSNNFDNLSFIHFAGFDYNNLEVVHKHYLDVPSNKFPALKELMQEYRMRLQENGFEKHITIPYKYNSFENGKPVIKFHRRLYRVSLGDQIQYINPFSCGDNSFYTALESKKLLANNNPDKFNEQNYNGVGRKLKIINKLFGMVKGILGFEKYALFIKFLARYARFENQYFLLKGSDTTQYINENRNQSS
ncbi:MAG: hypothetical protein EOO93_08525 [Pedobacter sp.]|nr:MAG: hypothetical protein EOO93_08525 [Pedobacter sp.]